MTHFNCSNGAEFEFELELASNKEGLIKFIKCPTSANATFWVSKNLYSSPTKPIILHHFCLQNSTNVIDVE
jgi:hypothetical protein